MSDTLQEREDQMNDKRETAIQLILSEVQQGYTIDEAVKRIINRHCRQDQVATTTTTNTHQNPTVWHDCCKGYDHAPWCAAYKEVDKYLHNGHSREVDGTGRVLSCSDCRSEHEPAARGGGDEWLVGSRSSSPEGDATIYTVKGRRWVGQVKAKLADQIVTEHNQYQRLVATLRQSVDLLRYLKDTAFALHVNDRHKPDAFSGCKHMICQRACQAWNEIAATSAVLNQQRSTSE